jgi:hypothetical protein
MALELPVVLSPQVHDVNVRTQPDVVGQIPAVVVGIGVNHDVITVPDPVVAIIVIVGRNLEKKPPIGFSLINVLFCEDVPKYKYGRWAEVYRPDLPPTALTPKCDAGGWPREVQKLRGNRA